MILTILITLYFAIGTFLAGLNYKDSTKVQIFIWIALGGLFPLLHFIVPFINWLDSKTEFKTLYHLYFTDDLLEIVKEDISLEILRNSYTDSNNYRKWILRQIGKKYNVIIQSN